MRRAGFLVGEPVIAVADPTAPAQRKLYKPKHRSLKMAAIRGGCQRGQQARR
jgi:hypothetical protein